MLDKKLIKNLQLFHQRIERLRSNKDFFVNLSFSLNYKNGEGTKTIFNSQDQKTIKAFLVDFRPFTLTNEIINFNYVSSQIFKSINNKDIEANKNLLKALKESREAWNKLLDKKESTLGGIKIQINNRTLIMSDNLDLWINGDYFHIAEDLQGTLDQLQSNPAGQISRFLFVDLVQRLSGILFWFDKNVVTEILNKYNKESD